VTERKDFSVSATYQPNPFGSSGTGYWKEAFVHTKPAPPGSVPTDLKKIQRAPEISQVIFEPTVTSNEMDAAWTIETDEIRNAKKTTYNSIFQTLLLSLGEYRG
jgi:hypothetical protein